MLFICSLNVVAGSSGVQVPPVLMWRLDTCHFGVCTCCRAWRVYLIGVWRARSALATRKYRRELACCADDLKRCHWEQRSWMQVVPTSATPSFRKSTRCSPSVPRSSVRSMLTAAAAVAACAWATFSPQLHLHTEMRNER